MGNSFAGSTKNLSPEEYEAATIPSEALTVK